ncbi:MAG: hypothetical protein B6U95_04060 [Thermofilum sp. ex4484_82]|nr:MAG: hypothetical protein B6U95_04060 [Thermofilum sp. ex4484_82]OYT38563.1 MAG: hypothetical protein B6U96_04055 [Archaeoglobales archaeon ex4484_92]
MTVVDLMSEAKMNVELRSKAIEKGRYELYNCFQCMRCTSGCTSMKLLELKPQCLKCTERCPQDAAPSDLITALRNLAFDMEANVPEAYLKVVSTVLEVGLIQEEQKVTSRDFEVYDREQLNLPKISKPDEIFKNNLLILLTPEED